MNKKLIMSYAPHFRGSEKTNIMMLDVIIALLPALIAGTYIFGYRALLVTAVCVGTAVLAEFLWQKLTRQKNTISDLSAVVTGMLLAFNLPVTIPFWIAAVGSVFAIIIVKQFFGGLGSNFMNPALAARAFLLASWAGHMTLWVAPGSKLPLFGEVDAVSQATPLALAKGGELLGNIPSYFNLFIGQVGGSIGETSALAILIGAAYLLIRRLISWRTPVAFIGTFAILTFVFGRDGFFTGDWLYHILSGGLMLGAFFMATDYATTPVTSVGRLIFGVGCGVLTFVIRRWGGYPEGVSYAILLMNVAAPLIEKWTRPKRYGGKVPTKFS